MPPAALISLTASLTPSLKLVPDVVPVPESSISPAILMGCAAANGAASVIASAAASTMVRFMTPPVGCPSGPTLRPAPGRNFTRLAAGAGSLAREPDARELPARVRREEVAVGRTHVSGRRGAGFAAQDVLAAHELAVVFADRAGRGAIAGVGRVRRRRPFPHVAVQLRGQA